MIALCPPKGFYNNLIKNLRQLKEEHQLNPIQCQSSDKFFKRLGFTFPSSSKVVDVHHGPGDDGCVTAVHAFLFLVDQVQDLLDNLSFCGGLNNLCANKLEADQFCVAIPNESNLYSEVMAGECVGSMCHTIEQTDRQGYLNC
jgi:hypothetical protein